MRTLRILLLLTLFSCSTGDRTPASLVTRYEMDLYELLSDLDRYLDQPSEKVCKGTLLEDKYQELYAATDQEIILENISSEAKDELVQKSFSIRLKQRKHLKYINATYTSWNTNCYAITRDISRALRYLEDILIEERFYADEKTAFTTLEGDKGNYFLVNPYINFDDYTDLRSGDIILSRGNAFTSAAISRIGVTDAQFSHLSFVYKDSVGKLHTTEAHIELGNVIAPIKKHINQANGRTVVFRYKGNLRTAKAASHKAYHRVGKAMRNAIKDAKKKFKVNKRQFLDYDFGMNYNDDSQLFCSEVASYGFKQYGVNIPRIKTKFSKNLLPFLQKIGIAVNENNISRFETFGPGDLEFDSRFELVAEWRNPKKLRALRHKDAILAKMFDWMENHKFYFDPTFGTKAKSKAAWLARRTRLQKNFFGKDLTKEFPLNMNPTQMDFFVTLDEVGAKMETRLRTLEFNKMKQKKKVLSFKESLQALDNYRREEERKIAQNRDWLKYFHP